MRTKLTINLPTLVLNKGWTPISIMPVKKAVTKVMSELAQILDPDTYTTHSFEEWMFFPVKDGDSFIQTSHSRVRVPEIIVLSEYDRLPQREVKLTRRNLLIRDNYTCQYSGKRINLDTATMDHVLPRSKGGGSTWENLVMCCLDVNSKKADRTPDEAGLNLLKKPSKPKWNPIYARFARLASTSIPDSWGKFIKSDGNPFGEPP